MPDTTGGVVSGDAVAPGVAERLGREVYAVASLLMRLNPDGMADAQVKALMGAVEVLRQLEDES